MVDEEHIGVTAIMGNKKRKKPDGAAADKADKADKPKVKPSLLPVAAAVGCASAG